MPVWMRPCLAVFLAGALVALPAWSTAARPLGQIVLAQKAFLDDTAAPNGSTVYAGDRLMTGNGGTLRLQSGSSQLVLLSASAATLNDATGLSATLERGAALFSYGGTDPVELRTHAATVRPKGGGATYAQVSVVGPNMLLIACQRGVLEVSLDGDVHLLSAGAVYRVMAVPEAAAADDSQTVPARRNRRKLAIIIFGSVSAAIAAPFIIHELTESPSKFDD